jgi:hypothetical protein
VKHPNIVRLFDVIETEKYIGIILDFANGKLEFAPWHTREIVTDSG